MVNLDIAEKIIDNYVLLEVSGVLSVENLRTFEKKLNHFFEEKKHILIDFSKITFIDSASLGILLLYFTKQEKNNLHLLLISVNDETNQLFDSIGITKLVNIFETVDKAVEFLTN